MDAKERRESPKLSEIKWKKMKRRKDPKKENKGYLQDADGSMPLQDLPIVPILAWYNGVEFNSILFIQSERISLNKKTFNSADCSYGSYV